MPNADRLKLEVARSARPFGLLVLLIAIAGVFGGKIAGYLTFERPWQDYRTIKAEFDDVKGVFPGGHQVRLNGVKVGVVEKAELQDGRAVLTLQLEKRWGPVYRNARMRIRPVTPLQDLYINITDRGTKDAGEATTATVIPGEQTATPVDVSRVLNTFNADTRERMAILLSELGRGLDDRGEQLKQSFAELAPFLRVAEDAISVLRRRDQQVERVVTNFGRLSAALAERDTDLNRFVRQGNATLGELARNDEPLAATFSGLAQLLPAMRSSFSSTRRLADALDPALRSLKPVSAELEDGLGGLRQFGEDARPALRKLRAPVRDLRTMARTLAPAATDLDAAFARLAKQAPQYDKITQQAKHCFDDGTWNDFFQQTLSVFKFRNAYFGFPRAETTFDTDFVSPSQSARGQGLTKQPLCTDKIGG